MKKFVFLFCFIICILNVHSQQEIKCKYILEGKTDYKSYDTKGRVLTFDTANNIFVIPDFDYMPKLSIKINRTENKPFRDGNANCKWCYGCDQSGENYILVMQEKRIHLFWILDEVNIKEYILSLE